MKRFWLAGLLLFAIALVVVGTPVYLIRPFVSQTAAGVSWSYVLRQASVWSAPPRPSGC